MNPIDTVIASFDRIGLDELNQRAELMTRRDTKYLLTNVQVQAFLARVKSDFDALDIDGKTAFSYDSAYFDSDNLHCFGDHNQNRRQRVKIRLRHYEDTQRFFMEIKLKGRNGATTKRRLPIEAIHFRSSQLPDELDRYLKSVVLQHHQRDLPYSYSKSLHVRYRRSTLIAKSGAERVTLDNRLNFARADKAVDLSSALWVIEVKSAKGVSGTDRILRELGARPAALCSKYCVGLSMTTPPQRSTRFTATVKKITALC